MSKMENEPSIYHIAKGFIGTINSTLPESILLSTELASNGQFMHEKPIPF
jgi:hypothetical protein